MSAPSPRPSSRSTPPGAWSPAHRVTQRAVDTVEAFLSVESSSGIVLLLAASIALVWANSPLQHGYRTLWETPLGLHVGPWSFTRDLQFFVNDGLMTIFFFVVGLEIRREIHCGELSDLRRAALPLAAALGGMLAPAGIYLLFNHAGPAAAGWGVPMATDIAFAVGVLAVLGTRVVPALRILLLALAVIDDIGAIIVIALFYSAGISTAGLVIGALGLALVLAPRALGLRSAAIYVPGALVLWAGLYTAGIHPTLAGVVVGLLTPVRPWDSSPSPADRLQHALHPWVAYLIMPLFAVANAGVPLGYATFQGDGLRVFVGITLGLLLGKPLGILALSWAFTKVGLATLPGGVSWRSASVVGLVAGVGFTMALFVAELAFPPGPLLETAKLAVLCGSAGAALTGLLIGRLVLPARSGQVASATK